jgi:hypothetical protein
LIGVFEAGFSPWPSSFIVTSASGFFVAASITEIAIVLPAGSEVAGVFAGASAASAPKTRNPKTIKVPATITARKWRSRPPHRGRSCTRIGVAE